MDATGLLETIGSQAGQKAALIALLNEVVALGVEVAALSNRVAELEAAAEPEAKPARKSRGKA